MTRKEYRKLYYKVLGTHHLRGAFWKKYREVLRAYQPECIKFYLEIKGKEFMKQPMPTSQVTLSDIFGNCEAATPCEPKYDYYINSQGYVESQEKGNNPMRIDTTTATAYVTAAKSDDATSREYLLNRLSFYEGWRNPKLVKLSELFNIGKDGRPGTYLQLIDAIKNDKFSLDNKAVKRLKRLQDNLDEDEDGETLDDYGYGPFYGIIFTDLPKADRDGYDAAVAEFSDLMKATKDTIMVKSPDEGLSALQALEAWMPAGKAN